MGFVDRIKGWLPRPAGDAPRPRPQSGFIRDGRSVAFGGWSPALREPSRDVELAWKPAAARAVNLFQNSGFISGAVDQAVADTVGLGLRLNARPDADSFGLTSREANALGREIETKWAIYQDAPIDVDAEARRNFGHLQAAAFRHWLATGEILAAHPGFVRPGGSWAAKVRLVPSLRLSTRTDMTGRLFHGVRLDRHGASVGYLFLEAPETGEALRMSGALERELPARDAIGRPVVSHVFDGMPGQVRGIGPLTPALQVARQFDQLANATLTSEIVRAVFVATLESDAPTQDVLAGLLTPAEQARAGAEGPSPFELWLDASQGWNKNVNIDVGDSGRFAHLYPGQKLSLHEASKTGTNFAAFVKTLQHELARCLGVTFESFAADWAGTTFTGARVATGAIHHVTLYRRKNIVAPFCQAAYECWLTEAVLTGRLRWPGGEAAFLANRPAACRAIWRGQPKAVIDDLKTAKAHEIWARLGVMTDEMIANELGVDIEDVYEQRQRERDMRAEYKLPEPSLMGHNGGPPLDAEDDEDDGDEGQASGGAVAS